MTDFYKIEISGPNARNLSFVFPALIRKFKGLKFKEMKHLSDIEIAQNAEMKPIDDIALKLGIESDSLEHF